MIKSISEMHGSNVDWKAVGRRVRQIRTSKDLSEAAAGEEIGYSEGSILFLEAAPPDKTKDRKCVNILFSVSQAWNLSLNWLLNGIGDCHDADPIELIPETLVMQKGAGIRRTSARVDAEEGTYGEEAMEFVIAVDKYMKVNDLSFPSRTQIFDIFLALGYRKCVPARIAPLGYDLEKQKRSERNNLEQEQESENILSEQNHRQEQNIQEACQARQKKQLIKQDIQRQLPVEKKVKRRPLLDFGHKRPPFTPKKPEQKSPLVSLLGEKKKKHLYEFMLTDPDGTIFTTHDLVKFCNKRNLNAVMMYKAASVCDYDVKSYQNWQAEIVYTELPSTKPQEVAR